MNELARETLAAYALEGRRQVVNAYRDSTGGVCGLGALLESIGELCQVDTPQSVTCRGWELLMDRFGLMGTSYCPDCDDHGAFATIFLVAHLQDTHGYTFLDLARRFPERSTDALLESDARQACESWA